MLVFFFERGGEKVCFSQNFLQREIQTLSNYVLLKKQSDILHLAHKI